MAISLGNIVAVTGPLSGDLTGTLPSPTVAKVATITPGSANGVATLNGSSKVVQDPASKAAAGGVASLNGSSLVVQNPASAAITPVAAGIPIADGTGKIAAGWLPAGGGSAYQRLQMPVFGNNTGTVSATIDYPVPNMLGEGETLVHCSSLSASGRVDICWEGVTFVGQTQFLNAVFPVKGGGATPQYQVSLYVEGTAAAVFQSGILSPTGAIVYHTYTFTITPPNTPGRYFVVVECYLNAGDSMFVGFPIVQNA